MFYTASYFQPKHHHGKLIAVSRTIPKGFRVDDRLEFLAPSQALLADWKAENITQEKYTERYREQLKTSWNQVQNWLSSLSPQENLSLLCWEAKDKFCHRNLVALLVKRHRQECFGGCDVVHIEMERCDRCGHNLIPGLDRSFCQNCRCYFHHRFSA